MFQNTLSNLTSPVIQQFLDELTFRELFGQYSLACFDSMIQKITAQTTATALKVFWLDHILLESNLHQTWGCQCKSASSVGWYKCQITYKWHWGHPISSLAWKKLLKGQGHSKPKHFWRFLFTDIRIPGSKNSVNKAGLAETLEKMRENWNWNKLTKILKTFSSPGT